MSRRFDTKQVCPHCGLLVAATADGKTRSHARLVLAADIRNVDCLTTVNPSRRDESADLRVAKQYQEQSHARLEHESLRRNDPDTALPAHLRG